MDEGTLHTITAKHRRNYAGKYHTNMKTTIPCYSIKQMKSLYPGADYHIVGEYAPGCKKESIGDMQCEKLTLNLTGYKSNSRLRYAQKGYLSAGEGEDDFVVLLKKVLLPRALMLVLCFALVTGGVFAAVNYNTLLPVAAPAKVADLESGAVDWKGVLPSDTGGVTQGIKIPGYKSITIGSNKKDVEVSLVNPEGNPCYFAISLLLDDGTELYKSKMIKPGLGLYNISLSKPLKPGEYPATIRYETYSLQDLSSLNGAQVKITLIAK